MFKQVRTKATNNKYQPRMDVLESREVLNATLAPLPVMSVQGTVTAPAAKVTIPLVINSSNYQFDSEGTVRLIFKVTSANGCTLDPAALRIRPVQSSDTPIVTPSQSDYFGRSVSATAGRFRPGSYQLEVSSERNTKGAFTLEAFLLGDVNNDRQVDAADLQIIKALNGVARNQATYLEAADVNFNGRIETTDHRAVQNNQGAAFLSRKGLTFADGQYATIPVAGSLQTAIANQKFTLETWIQIDQYYNNEWFSVIDGENWTIQVHSNTGLELASYSGGSKYFGFVPQLGIPYHVAVDYDQLRGSVILYVNGDLYGEVAYTGQLAPSENLLLGVNPFGALEYSYGKIDDLRIWSTSRTAAQVKANFNKELRGNEAGLVGYWKMNEGAGKTFLDSTSNKNHGQFPVSDSEQPMWSDHIAGQPWQTAKILYFNQAGQLINSWKFGETIVVEVTGGNPALHYVQVHWQSNAAGAPANLITFKADYDYKKGVRYTINTGFYSQAVSFTMLVKADSMTPGYVAGRTIFRNGNV